MTALDPNAPLTALILTLNEHLHLQRCIESIAPLCARIVVVDSGSSDGTPELARSLGAEVHHHDWPGSQAAQLNFALDALAIESPWVLRIDADEYFTPELRAELGAALGSVPPQVTGLVLPRLVLFQGYPVRFGGFSPQWLLRVWRTGKARSEERAMDEHMVLFEGRATRLHGRLIDHNRNDVFWWTEKHNRYARREAAEIVAVTHRLRASSPQGPTLAGGPAVKRWVKERLYLRLPLGFRALLYFFWRFFVRLGFLDHPRVWVFHVLQAGWYRLLVDVNVREFETAVGQASEQEKLAFLRKRWQISLHR